MAKRTYEQPPPVTKEAAAEIEARADLYELTLLPVGVSLYADDLEWATALCARLAAHPDQNVAGNAVLGFGHLARRFGTLDREIAHPIIQRALSDPRPHVAGHAKSAASDTRHFLGWEFSES